MRSKYRNSRGNSTRGISACELSVCETAVPVCSVKVFPLPGELSPSLRQARGASRCWRRSPAPEIRKRTGLRPIRAHQESAKPRISKSLKSEFLGMSPLRVQNMLMSNPLKSRSLVRELTVQSLKQVCKLLRLSKLKQKSAVIFASSLVLRRTFGAPGHGSISLTRGAKPLIAAPRIPRDAARVAKAGSGRVLSAVRQARTRLSHAPLLAEGCSTHRHSEYGDHARRPPL